MPIEFEPGTTITVVPPGIPGLRAPSPTTPTVKFDQPSSTATVVPVVGPPGPAGGEAFQFSQITPATVWTINHNLGRYPGLVQLYTSDLSANYGEFVVQHLDVNTLRVSMETPTAGIAFLS